MQKEEVETKVQEVQDILTTWNMDVSELRAHHPWLLYFSVSKILLLHEVIKISSIEKIVHEVNFLVIESRECLEKKVEVRALSVDIISACNFPLYYLQKILAENISPIVPDCTKAPMEVVGHFLDVLLMDYMLPQRHAMMDSQILPHSQGISDHYSQPLYCSSANSQMDFTKLVLKVFSGVLQSYQVMRCQATTTSEELNLFLKRVETHHMDYLMLGINKLSFQLQEV